MHVSLLLRLDLRGGYCAANQSPAFVCPARAPIPIQEGAPAASRHSAHASLAGSSGTSGACSPVSSNSATLSAAIPTAVTRDCIVMFCCRASSSAVPRAASVAHVSCASVLAFSTISGRLRIKAATADTSVSALVRDFLTRFAGEESEFEKLQRQEEELRRSVTIFRASDRLSREELHDRHAVS